MSDEPHGTRTASFVANAGVEQSELARRPCTLVDAGLVEGNTQTSWSSLQTEIRNVSGTWVDQEVFVCPTAGVEPVTSREFDDLDTFGKQLVTTCAGSS